MLSGDTVKVEEMLTCKQGVNVNIEFLCNGRYAKAIDIAQDHGDLDIVHLLVKAGSAPPFNTSIAGPEAGAAAARASR